VFFVPLFHCHELWGGARGLDTLVTGKGLARRTKAPPEEDDSTLEFWSVAFCRTPRHARWYVTGQYGA